MNDRIRNQVLVNRLTATSSKVTIISWWGMLENYRWNWCWLSWQISRLTFTCEYNLNDFVCCISQMKREFRVFINQLNFRPTSIGKHNSMGHLLPCAIDFKTSHLPIHLQWIGILGMATEPCHVISMGPHQPEVSGEAIVCSDISVACEWLYIDDLISFLP